MKQVISVRDLEEMVRSGKDVRSLPEDALVTPAARDFLRELENGNGREQGKARNADAQWKWKRTSQGEECGCAG